MAASWSDSRAVIGMAAVAISAALLAFAFSDRDEHKILAELERLSRSEPVSGYMSNLSHVCFNFNNADVKGDFSREAARIGQPFSLSPGACGTENSCCRLDSNANGVIGLVSNDTIRCVAINTYIFVPAAGRAMCVKPSRLVVRQKNFSEVTPLPGRARPGTPGQRYYEIAEIEP